MALARAGAARATGVASIPRGRGEVLFTSRPFAAPHGISKQIHLQELTDDKLKECAEKCERLLAPETALEAQIAMVDDFMKTLGDDERRKGLARRPGHLVLMYILFREGEEVPMFEEDLLDRIAQYRLSDHRVRV